MISIATLPYGAQIQAAARSHGLDPRLLAAVAAQETGGPGTESARNIVGDGGHGRGLFQIDDRYHAFARTPAAMNPGANADYAAGMIAGLLRTYGGNLHEALSAYNAGDPHAEGSMTTWQDGSTLDYADSVLRHYADLAGSAQTAASQPSAPPAPQIGLGPMQLGAPFQPSETSHSYRQMAGLDANGNPSGSQPDYGSIVDADDSSEPDSPLP